MKSRLRAKHIAGRDLEKCRESVGVAPDELDETVRAVARSGPSPFGNPGEVVVIRDQHKYPTRFFG